MRMTEEELVANANDLVRYCESKGWTQRDAMLSLMCAGSNILASWCYVDKLDPKAQGEKLGRGFAESVAVNYAEIQKKLATKT